MKTKFKTQSWIGIAIVIALLIIGSCVEYKLDKYYQANIAQSK